MILYHGSYMEVNAPTILLSERGRDFGPAFYVTPIKEQAERWAKRKAKIVKGSQPIVSVFEWDEDKEHLSYKNFKEPDLEWLEIILLCRRNPKYVHGFDIVEGKIADDSVGETVLFVADGIIKKEDAVERLKFQKINAQIAFCTPLSLKHLRFISSYKVE